MLFKRTITSILLGKRQIPTAKQNLENSIKSTSNSMHSKASRRAAPQQTTFQYHGKPKHVPPTIIKRRISDFKQFPLTDSLASTLRWAYFPKYTSEKVRQAKEVKTFSIKEAIATKSVDEQCSIRALCNLGGDTANGIRDVIRLPHSSICKKNKRFIVITSGTTMGDASSNTPLTSTTKEDLVGSSDVIHSILSSSVNLSLYDGLYATPDMMPSLTKVARILGPLGMMPNLKTGTLTKDLQSSIQKGREEEAFLIKKDKGIFKLKIAHNHSNKDLKKIEENFIFCMKYLMGKGANFISELEVVFSDGGEGSVNERVLKINPSIYKGDEKGQKYIMALEKCRAAASKRPNSYINQ